MFAVHVTKALRPIGVLLGGSGRARMLTARAADRGADEAPVACFRADMRGLREPRSGRRVMLTSLYRKRIAALAVQLAKDDPALVKNITVALPPPSEAKSICKHAAAAEAWFAEIIAAGEDCIRVLQERRTALISAAVTGQIDVRHTSALEVAPVESAVDIAAGRFVVVESSAPHVARKSALARTQDIGPPVVIS